jgi:hypothetical protein
LVKIFSFVDYLALFGLFVYYSVDFGPNWGRFFVLW